MVPRPGARLGFRVGLSCGMDFGVRFLLGVMLDKANRYVFSQHSSTRTEVTINEIAELASDGAEDLSKI